MSNAVSVPIIFKAMPERPAEFPRLPCYPCPHGSACCAYGATVSEAEAAAIIAVHGEGKVYRTRWGEWRTRVKAKRCVFLVNNACSIYKESYYPAVCGGFPWVDAETGGPYEYDRTICPEFDNRPELVTIYSFRSLPVAAAPAGLGGSTVDGKAVGR